MSHLSRGRLIRIGLLACFILFVRGLAVAPALTAPAPPLEPHPDLAILAQADEPDDVAEVYRLYCSTCHGDEGQGLTDEWRARNFPPTHQNCWQSKCHTLNHDPGGFVFPKTVPAIVGPETLSNFQSAQDLYAFTRAAMPFYAPGLLTDEQYRLLTLYLVEKNFAAAEQPLPSPLPDELSAIPLHADGPPANGSNTNTPHRGLDGVWEWLRSIQILRAALCAQDPTRYGMCQG